MSALKGGDVDANELQRLNANHDDIHTGANNSTGISATSRDQNGTSRESQLHGVTAPIVSVVSSSMDLFGPIESNNPQTLKNVDGTTTASSQSVLAHEFDKYGVLSNHFAAGTKIKNIEQANDARSKSIKRSNKADGHSVFSVPKKSKQSIKATGEKSNHSTVQYGADTNASDMSFERAAVVAALTTLYGAANEKPSAKLSIGAPTTAFDGKTDATSGRTSDEKPASYSLEKQNLKTNENSAIKSSPKKKVPNTNQATTVSNISPIVQHPTQYDVLLGRGKSNKNHPGNVWFQDYIQANRDRYFSAPTNVQKRQITMEILETIRKKGRFLRRGSQGWVDVNTADVQQKVAHALQYRRRCELKESINPETDNPHFSNISHPPHRIGLESDPGNKLPSNHNNNNNFDASAIALAIVNTAGNYTMARLDEQTRQEQYKVNQEYYQNYLNKLQRPIIGVQQGDQRVGNNLDSINAEVRANNSLPQSQLPLYAIPTTHAQRLPAYLSTSLPTNNVTGLSIPETASSSSTISNVLLSRLNNSEYRNNFMLNGNIIVTDSASATDEQPSSPPSSENLDSSGLHSLADVITQLCSRQEGTDDSYPHGYSRL